MRAIPGGGAAQPAIVIGALASWVLIEVEDHLGAFQDLTADAVSVEYDETTDEIVNDCTVMFRRREGVNSLAPLMTANPPLDLGRDIRVSVNVGGGTWRYVFYGTIDAIDWPERFGDVTVKARDQAGVIADTWIEEEIAYGSTAGVDLETVMQSVATDHLASPPTIYVPVPTSALVTPAYAQQLESVLSAERTLAESIGWVIRWRYIDSLSAWRWTLFAPERAKTTPDHTFGTTDYFDVTVMSQEIGDIRNVIEVVDATGASVTVEDSASITRYNGRRYMKITEASDSPINNDTLATALANAALSDLKDPDAIVEIAAPYFWPGEVGVDLYRFTANGKHFSADQDLAPMAFRHRLAIGERPETKILCRGKPSGGVLMWRRRGGGTGPADDDPGAPTVTLALAEVNTSTGKYVQGDVTLNTAAASWKAWDRDGSWPTTDGLENGALDDRYLRARETADRRSYRATAAGGVTRYGVAVAYTRNGIAGPRDTDSIVVSTGGSGTETGALSNIRIPFMGDGNPIQIIWEHNQTIEDDMSGRWVIDIYRLVEGTFTQPQSNYAAKGDVSGTVTFSGSWEDTAIYSGGGTFKTLTYTLVLQDTTAVEPDVEYTIPVSDFIAL